MGVEMELTNHTCFIDWVMPDGQTWLQRYEVMAEDSEDAIRKAVRELSSAERLQRYETIRRIEVRGEPLLSATVRRNSQPLLAVDQIQRYGG